MNKDFFLGVLAGASLILILAFFFLPAYSVSVVHSPSAEEEIISFIDSAGDSIYVEVYLLTSMDVVDSLILAHQRGVDVKVILEGRVSGSPNALAYSRLAGTGIDVCWASEAYKLTHSKLIIVDEKKAFVGSHNLSYSALNLNREISLIVEGKVVSTLLELFNYDYSSC